jgi:hypothetical protein
LQFAARLAAASKRISSVDAKYLVSFHNAALNTMQQSRVDFCPSSARSIFFPSSELWFYPDTLNETMKL